MQVLDQNDQLLELQLLDKNIDKCQLLKLKKVEQSRFEQMHFEQLTLTRLAYKKSLHAFGTWWDLFTWL